jgi:adenylate cyclase
MCTAVEELLSRRQLPLFGVVGAAVVSLLLLVLGSVVAPTYVSSRAVVDKLWRALASEVADHTAREALRFLEPALPFADTTATALKDGELDPMDDAAVLAWLEIAIDANPQFTWTSFGRSDGTFLAMYKWPVGETEVLRRTHRTVIGRESAETALGGDMPRARFADFQRDEAGVWHSIPATMTHYDPRKRPWYKSALEVPEGVGVWQEPYIFLSRMQPGVAYAKRVADQDGSVIGVVAAEFEASPLSRFVQGLEIGETGRVYLVDTQSGAVIAHPTDQVVNSLEEGPRVLRASTHPDPMLRGAWNTMQSLDVADQALPFEFGPYLAVAQAVGGRSQLPWTSITVVPADEFFGDVHGQLFRSLVISVVATLVAILLAFVGTRRLSRHVAEVSSAMRRMALFEFPDKDLAVRESSIQELRQMGDAAHALRHGLRSFGRYVPHQLVRQLLRSGQEARLGGEKRIMTVLFSDIEGFTPLVERTPPEVILSALGEYLGRMNVAIGQSGGTVCQYLGDAIMAFWGAPEPQEDHALRACQGALAMRAAAEALVAEAARGETPAFPTRFGINSGQVMVGNIGAPDRFNYAILGDAVNAAARLEGLNKVYGTSIIVGEATVETVGAAMCWRQLDWVRAKGKKRSMAIFELVGAPEDVDEETRLALGAYQDALEAYRERRFVEAGAAFGALIGHPMLSGEAASVLAERCEKYRANPPLPDWDGAFSMEHK